MSEIEAVIDGLNRISLLAQLRDKVVEARVAAKPRCGNCHWWMKSRDCPREHNVKGMTRGPDAGGLPCSKHQWTDSSLALFRQRYAEAVAFAEQHDLPVPSEPRP